MSVYIKGMEMPVDCMACRVACDKENYGVIGRPPKCPLAEAPVGDLIGRAETIEAVELMEIFLGERKKKAVIRGIQALPSAETHEIRTETHGVCLISKDDAIEAVRKELVCDGRHDTHDKVCRFIADVLLPALPSAEYSKPLQTTLNGDLVSRADAIEAVRLETAKRGLLGRGDILDILSELPSAEAVSHEEHVKELNDLAVEWKAKFAKAEKRTNEIYDETMVKVANECKECKERLLNLRPSAEAEWIPCNEKLPEESGTYWVCTDTGHQYECRWTNNRFGIGEGEWGWSIFDTPQYTKPIAWMPLPKPYREESEVGE